ncbi:MAG: hypothetical protein ACHQ1G_07760 [Planctomycetota bacterium]
MRGLLCCIALCPCALAGEGDAAKLAPAVRALPPGWRFRDLAACPECKDRFPCAIAEDGGKVVVAFAEPSHGGLDLSTNLYSPPSFLREEPENGEEYWDNESLGKESLAQLDLAIGDDVVAIVWVPLGNVYDPRWTESVGGPGRWQAFFGDPNAPPMPSFPAFALARTKEKEIIAVHNDPEARALEYLARPRGMSAVAIPVAAKEEVVSLAVQGNGTIHALTFLDRKLSYLTNKGGAVKREILETGDLTEIRGAVAADEMGAAHVASRDSETEGLLYRTNVSGKWISIVVERGADAGVGCAIAVDAKGREHIAYTTPSGVRYATNTAGGWEVFAVAAGQPLPGCDVAIDAQGYVHMCYAVGGKMVYATNRPQEKK